MRVLVTGASGFIGRAASAALVKAGHDVVGLTRDPQVALPAGVIAALGSIGDPTSVAMAATGAEAIVNAAGVTHPRAPERVLRWVHIAGTENVVMAARHVGVRRVVHLSCADATLCRDPRMHWAETRALPHDPVGCLARTQLIAEELALSQSGPGLEVTALRPARVWGPGDVQGLAALKHELDAGGVSLYDEGRNVLATAHIDNVVQALGLALTANAAPGRAYYITDGEFLEARELFTALLGALGRKARFRHRGLAQSLLAARIAAWFGRTRGPREAEILQRGQSALFDLSNAARDLGYSPTLNFEAQLRGLSDWVAEAGGLDAVAARARPAPKLADVDAQVALAGGE